MSLRLIFIVLALWGPSTALAALSLPSIDANTTRGYAPLAVFFDAFTPVDDSTRNEGAEFTELAYVWEFGDPISGTWRVSGEDKNAALGPIAAHVFEPTSYPNVCGGVSCRRYTVTVSIGNDAGENTSATRVIEVLDPNTLATYCVCADANGDNRCDQGGVCSVPGATQVTDDDFDSVMNSLKGSNRQILFQRGDTFRQSQTVDLVDGPLVIGAYGSGAKPVISNSANSNALGLPYVDDVRVSDLKFDGPDVPTTSNDHLFLNASGQASSKVLLNRLDIVQYNRAISMHGTSSQQAVSREIFYVELTVSDMADAGKSGAMIYLDIDRSAILGIEIEGSTLAEHNLRWMRHERGIVQHSLFQNGAATKDLTTVRGCNNGVGLQFCKPGFINRWMLYSFNTARLSGSTWGPAFVPNNSGSDDQFRQYGIVESNYVELSGLMIFGLNVQADNYVVRNNTCNATELTETGTSGGGVVHHCVRIMDLRGGVTSPPLNTSSINNTLRGERSGPRDLWSVTMVNGATNSCSNDLLYVAESASTVEPCVNGSWNPVNSPGSHEASTNPFVSSDPKSAADFHLVSGSSARDVGVASADVLFDFSGNCRSAIYGGDGKPDAGASEYGSAGCSFTGDVPATLSAPFILD